MKTTKKLVVTLSVALPLLGVSENAVCVYPYCYRLGGPCITGGPYISNDFYQNLFFPANLPLSAFPSYLWGPYLQTQKYRFGSSSITNLFPGVTPIFQDW